MRSIRSSTMISLVSMALMGLAPGCATDAPDGEEDLAPAAEEAEAATDQEAPDEVTGEALAGPESDGAAKPDPGTSSANSYGEWCHAWCWNNVVYAGADVTKNCASWADMVCQHRNTVLYDAYWCLPNACRVDVILY